MTAVNWDSFSLLPGSVTNNFELLCRALIRNHYGQFGEFRARAAQPGVEFHLKVSSTCSLGSAGRWYGWQCRWYNLPSGQSLGTARRKKIEDAIALTERAVPGITDWVLWTRHPLTAGDQKWFDSISTKLKRHQWTSAEVEAHLSGPAEIFRGTFFGELVLTTSALEELHGLAVAPIRRRWRREIHQETTAERTLQKQLIASARWDDIAELISRIDAEASQTTLDLKTAPKSLVADVAQVIPYAKEASSALSASLSALKNGDIDALRPQLLIFPKSPNKVLHLPHRLRAARHRAAPILTNLLSSIRDGRTMLQDIHTDLGTRSVAIVADAGCGKTHLSAELTAAKSGIRPAGIFLLGSSLRSNHSLDDLARLISIQGTPVKSMEALLAAVDAAGQREGRRLPVVIDGLNEAEDPRRWKTILAPIDEVLKKYPYVLVVYTLRGSFADEALPNGIGRIEVKGFEEDTNSAMRRYFDYYKIDGSDADLPTALLAHPLTLQLFCEVTNPKREKTVGVEAMPGSLTGLFDRYLEQAAERISELSPISHRFYAQDVAIALNAIGTALWDRQTRELDREELRRQLGDDIRTWDTSMARALELEGILLRAHSDNSAIPKVGIAYDALAGHLVATSIIGKLGSDGFKTWIKDSTNTALLEGAQSELHPLADDITRALAGVVPRKLQSQQLWKLADEPIRSKALANAAYLESSYLDTDTVAELERLAPQQPLHNKSVLVRSWSTRGSQHHPLNSTFLDRLLRPLGVADRDLFWTEWLRRNRAPLQSDFQNLQRRWRRKKLRDIDDQLRARWVMWALTSTVSEIRDNATCALYWFGRVSPSDLFELTIDSLSINDPYVPQRMLAACYGVTLSHQLQPKDFEKPFATFLTSLAKALTGSSGSHPTNDWLARLYVSHMVEFAQKFYPSVIPPHFKSGARSFAPGIAYTPIPTGSPHAEEMDWTMQMDFENYTLGGLFEGRGNYDMGHAGHQAAVAHVRGVAWELGWRKASLGSIDSQLLNISRGSAPRTERYGKKYGWIGFYSYAGMLDDGGKLKLRHDARLSELQIDPSFPEKPERSSETPPIWVSTEPRSDQQWAEFGKIDVPKKLQYRREITGHKGPWILVDGYWNTKDQSPRRRVWGLFSTLLVNARKRDQLIKSLSHEKYLGNFFLPRAPEDHYTFAGEIPWSSQFASSSFQELYYHSIPLPNGSKTKVEILAHGYAWESYHSPVNTAGGASIPSKAFSAAFDLRSLPQSFNQVLPDGTLATVSEEAPEGHEGHLLYVREDLLRRYAAGRAIVLTAWGERELHHSRQSPAWLTKIRQEHRDLWRHIRDADKHFRLPRPRKSKRR